MRRLDPAGCIVSWGRIGFREGTGWGPWAKNSHQVLGPYPSVQTRWLGLHSVVPTHTVAGSMSRAPGACWRRAIYAADGVRGVGFDNDRGKGDHCHLHGWELPYMFTTVDALVGDFIAAVDAARRKP